MTKALLRGIHDVSKPRSLQGTTFLSRRPPRFSDPSFCYHVPRRIPPRAQAAHFSNKLLLQKASQSICYESTRSFSNTLSKSSSCGQRWIRIPEQSSIFRSQKAVFSPLTIGNGYRANLDYFPKRRAQGTLMRQIENFHTTRHIREDSKINEKASGAVGKSESATGGSGTGKSQSHGENFYDRLQMPQFHRPTKEELLAAATGFWSRLRVRFKWLTIKSVRPFNMDEIVGFFSWIVLGHVVWIVIGTTTFVSLAILAINTVFAQETLAGWIGNYLTKSSGLTVVFESAIVPKWSDGVITFKNVYVSRRPGHETRSSVRKGSPEAAALAAAAEKVSDEDQNYTQFDVTLGEVNVTLSFNKWWNSKGPLQNVEVKHVRGIVDRTHVYWTGEYVDPKSFKHEHNPGDFEIESFKIEDLLLTVHQPGEFRPFPVSIYNAELPRLRKHWLFYDFLCANSMTGEFDRSIFTIHPRQTHSYTGAHVADAGSDADEPWKKHSRIRIDALNIDHLNRGVEGPFGWIREGNVDIVADILIPNDNDESVMKVMSDFYERIEATLTSQKHLEARHLNANGLESTESSQTTVNPDRSKEEDKRFVIMDLRVHLNDVRAAVPIFTKDLSYINSALIRPIVAYINSRRTFIPINCRVVKRAIDFDGSWTIYDSGLMDDVSAEVYDAFARDVQDEEARMRRFKKVGLWSLQLAVQAIFLGMAGNIA